MNKDLRYSSVASHFGLHVRVNNASAASITMKCRKASFEKIFRQSQSTKNTFPH